MRPAVILTLPVSQELKELIGQAADEEGLPMNEWVARELAKVLKRPDVAEIPRKSMGRPRKVLAV